VRIITRWQTAKYVFMILIETELGASLTIRSEARKDKLDTDNMSKFIIWGDQLEGNAPRSKPSIVHYPKQAFTDEKNVK
jgi:hypothetical protein